MDRDVIERKLESLRHCLLRIEAKCPTDAQALAMDPDVQDMIALNLSRAAQVCVYIGAHVVAGMPVPLPDTMGQTFDMMAQGGVLSATLALEQALKLPVDIVAVQRGQPGSAFARMARAQAQPLERST